MWKKCLRSVREENYYDFIIVDMDKTAGVMNKTILGEADYRSSTLHFEYIYVFYLFLSVILLRLDRIHLFSTKWTCAKRRQLQITQTLWNRLLQNFHILSLIFSVIMHREPSNASLSADPAMTSIPVYSVCMI